MTTLALEWNQMTDFKMKKDESIKKLEAVAGNIQGILKYWKEVMARDREPTHTWFYKSEVQSLIGYVEDAIMTFTGLPHHKVVSLKIVIKEAKATVENKRHPLTKPDGPIGPIHPYFQKEDLEENE